MVAPLGLYALWQAKINVNLVKRPD
jgi:hypothetical protein